MGQASGRGKRVGKEYLANHERDVREFHYQPLLILFAPLCIGAVVDRWLVGWFAGWLVLACLGLLAWIGCWASRREVLATLCLLVAVACIGGAWHRARWSQYSVDELAWHATVDGRPVVIEAVAVDGCRWLPPPPEDPLVPRQMEGRSQLKLSVRAIRNGEIWQPARGRVSLTVRGKLETIQSGDMIRVSGILMLPDDPRNPGEFHFAQFLRVKRELCRFSATCPAAVTLLKQGSAWSPSRWISWIRLRGQRLLIQHIQPTHLPLASALLLGSREQLGSGQTEMFLTSGTIHLLAISGLHVGILAGGIALLATLVRLSNRMTLALVVAFVVSYALIADARPSVVRASILIVLVCSARVVGRRALGFNSLAAAAILIFALHPAHLFQVGTQLSFLAVATLIFIAPGLQWRLPKDALDRLIVTTRPLHVRILSRGWFSVRQLVAASCTVWLVALPLVMYHFHIVSLVGLVLNPVIWIPLSIALFAGFLLLLSASWFPLVAGMCGRCCDQSLGMMEAMLRVSQLVPANHCWTVGPAMWWMCCHYGLLTAWCLCPKWRPRWYWAMTLCVGWLTVGVLTSPHAIRARSSAQTPRLVMTFISVGHGTSVLLECPDGSNLLYDAGHLGAPQVAARKIAAVLWARGITDLDGIMISHADLDHYNAIPELLKRFGVQRIYVSPSMFSSESGSLDYLQAVVESRGIDLRVVSANQSLSMQHGLRMKILHPPLRRVASSDNANSIVLLLEFAGRRILLPGDIEGLGLAALLQTAPIDCDIAMAPHHGSSHSRPMDFQNWATPEWLVVSSGRERTMPLADTTTCAQTVHGAVRFLIESDGCLLCQRWDGSRWYELATTVP